MENLETRIDSFVELGVELRADDDEGATLRGHAAVFDKLSVEMWGMREKIDPGAFDESLKKDDVRAFYNHDMGRILGRTSAGTLSLSTDKRGLAFVLDLPRSATDVAESVDRGDISGMSFGFITLDEKWEREADDNGKPSKKPAIRTLMKVRLIEVSPVVFPADPQPDVAKRSYAAFLKEQDAPRREYERRQRLLDAASMGVILHD